MSHQILVVEDHEGTKEILSEILSMAGYEVVAVSDQNRAITIIKAQQFDAVLVDLRLPTVYGSGDENEAHGFAVVDAIQKHSPNAWVVVMTAYGNAQNARQLVETLGANEFVDKPIDYEDLLLRLKEGLSSTERSTEIQAEFYEWPAPPPPTFLGIVGQTPAIQKVCKGIQTYATSPLKFGLVWGESGTGKELVSQAIHECSPQYQGACLTYNCAAITETLAASELFGIAKRVANDVDERPGYFQRANRGTLILDEAQNLPEDIQAQLLRAVQYGDVQRVGGTVEKVDVRTILVTNIDLSQAAKAGKFRQDLFNRLFGFKIYIPPLRERKADIPHLVNHFIRQYVKALGEKPDQPKTFPLKEVSKTVWELLDDYDWPGNLHELKGIVENALIYLRGTVLSAGDILRAFRETRQESQKEVLSNNPLDAWYHFLKALSSSGRQINYDHFKRYAVMRAIDEITIPLQDVKWRDVGERVGLEDKRVFDLLKAIASDFGMEPVKLRQDIKGGKNQEFVKKAIKYYEEQLSRA